ncbi:hypothetical protein [Kitasatospora sp. NPDC005856]|uniref:hypothetical protein n=1 Tax=Kitasatospora sp. NPDC005856 TaxID=3154566 RepID=UPI0033C3B8F2
MPPWVVVHGCRRCGRIRCGRAPGHDRHDVAVSSYRIAADLFPASKVTVGGRGNLIPAICEATGIELAYDWRACSTFGTDLTDADLLGVPIGTAPMVREGVSCSPDGDPVLYVRRRLKGDAVRFVLQYRNRDWPGHCGPAAGPDARRAAGPARDDVSRVRCRSARADRRRAGYGHSGPADRALGRRVSRVRARRRPGRP